MESGYESIWFLKQPSKAVVIKALLFVIYAVSLCFAYIRILSPMYSYALLTYKPNFVKLIISIGLSLIAILLVPADKNKPSTYLYFIYFTVCYIPTVNYYWLNDQPTRYIVYVTICFLLISLMLRIKIKAVRIGMISASVALQILLVVLVVLCVYLVYKNRGIHLSALISDLYGVRSENNTSGLLGYALNWCAKSFIPLFLAYFLLRRQWIGVAFVSVLQIILFLSFGFKAFLMSILLIIGVSILMIKPNNFKEKWLLVLAAGNIGGVGLAKGISTQPIFLFTYRTLFVPSQGQFEYYDYFTHHNYLFFSEGKIGRLLGFQYPYNETIGRVVNHYIYGPSKNSNGNTGALSYGFADLGVWGMILAAIIIALILLAIDASTDKLPILIPVAAMSYAMITLNDVNVLICLNSGGIIWSIILLNLLNTVFRYDPRLESGTERRKRRKVLLMIPERHFYA